MPTTPFRVGFIGLGSQGAPMARRIVESGFPLSLWARRPQSLEPFADTQAGKASSPAVLARECSVVCVCVTGDADVDEVVLNADGVLAGMAPGGTIVIHSTVHPDTCIRLSQQAGEQGVALLDAPVSGGAPAAEEGTLLVMVGGEATVLDQVRPVLATFGDPILHLGGVGAGQTAKLTNNLVFTAQIALALDAFAFIDALGLDRAAMAQVFERGSGASRAASILSNSGFDLSGLATIARPLLDKDLRLILDVAGKQRVELPAALRELAEDALATLGAIRSEVGPS
jgi:3-hydroxyisobutyrate dehydrogenase